MKKLLNTEIESLSRLSQLQLSDEEKAKIASQFTETISYVDNLNDLDTSTIDSLTNITGQINRYFEDGAPNTRLLTQAEATGQSKDVKDGMFKVPKVLSK